MFLQVERALRDIARVNFCSNVDSLLKAVCVIMAVEDGENPRKNLSCVHASNGGVFGGECEMFSMSEVRVVQFTISLLCLIKTRVLSQLWIVSFGYRMQ